MKWLKNVSRERVSKVNSKKINRDGDYILCIVRKAIRGVSNPLIDSAIELANEKNLPVIVLFSLHNDYPFPSERLHTFLYEASVGLEDQIIKRQMQFVRIISEKGLAQTPEVVDYINRASAIFTDDYPLDYWRRELDDISKISKSTLFAIDSNCLVPCRLIETTCSSAKDFRSKHSKLRDKFLREKLDLIVKKKAKNIGKLSETNFAPHRLDIDHSVGAISEIQGDYQSANRLLYIAVKNIVAKYKWIRNNPALPYSTSKLSPYITHGIISSRQILEVLEASEIPKSYLWKFKDELLTWREYSYHLAYHLENFECYEAIPNWAKESLEKHIADPREEIYSLAELIAGDTKDELWNMAQKQFTIEGWMHNNLRMYWVKQIIKWTPSPEVAFDTAKYLNDRFSLDGRDPATYLGIHWGFGRGKKAYSESDIYGLVSKKSSSALMRRDGVSEMIAAYCKMDGSFPETYGNQLTW